MHQRQFTNLIADPLKFRRSLSVQTHPWVRMVHCCYEKRFHKVSYICWRQFFKVFPAGFPYRDFVCANYRAFRVSDMSTFHTRFLYVFPICLQQSLQLVDDPFYVHDLVVHAELFWMWFSYSIVIWCRIFFRPKSRKLTFDTLHELFLFKGIEDPSNLLKLLFPLVSLFYISPLRKISLLSYSLYQLPFFSRLSLSSSIPFISSSCVILKVSDFTFPVWI